MKHIILGTICITMLLLTACGSTKIEAQPITDHVLTILARNNYEAPIRQAEQALLAEWAQRPDKEGHTLTIELTTFHPNDEANQLTRLDTMLMAGQAYDIFFPVADHRHIREYAQSGFVTDFYPLIEDCPYTNINDFFTNALEAWEIDGGLHVFPWDFSFNYAFVNMDLPQDIISRFTQLNAISVAQLVNMYHDLLQYHAHDFAHFNFSHGGTLHHPSKIVVAHMNNFIDFKSHAAHLTDDAFITFITDFTSVFDDRHLRGQDRQYWTNWWKNAYLEGATYAFNPHSLRMIARGANSFTWGTGWHAQWRWEAIESVTMQPNAFLVESRNLFPGAAVIHEEVFLPYFAHGIPLTDEYGRLLIADRTEYPAGISISSAANGAIAWDFSRHLINAFNKREVHSFQTLFYPHSLGIPIVRDLFDFRVYHSIFNAYIFYSSFRMFPSIGTGNMRPGEEWRVEHARAMVPYILELAEMPMTLTRPPIPDFLYADNLELLLRGIIAPQDFAQRTQNAVSLWLIGG